MWCEYQKYSTEETVMCLLRDKGDRSTFWYLLRVRKGEILYRKIKRHIVQLLHTTITKQI
jgi:hypothetical protein